MLFLKYNYAFKIHHLKSFGSPGTGEKNFFYPENILVQQQINHHLSVRNFYHFRAQIPSPNRNSSFQSSNPISKLKNLLIREQQREKENSPFHQTRGTIPTSSNTRLAQPRFSPRFLPLSFTFPQNKGFPSKN